MCIHKCKQTYLEQLVICTSRSSFALINSCHQRRQLPVIFLLGFKYLFYHLEWIRFVACSVSIWCFSCCHHFHFNGLKPLNNKKNPLKMFSSFQLHALSHILPTSTLPLPLCWQTCVESCVLRHGMKYFMWMAPWADDSGLEELFRSALKMIY